MSTTPIPRGWRCKLRCWCVSERRKLLMLMWLCTTPAEQNAPVINRWLCWTAFSLADLAPANDVDASLLSSAPAQPLEGSKLQRTVCGHKTASTARWSQWCNIRLLRGCRIKLQAQLFFACKMSHQRTVKKSSACKTHFNLHKKGIPWSKSRLWSPCRLSRWAWYLDVRSGSSFWLEALEVG